MAQRHLFVERIARRQHLEVAPVEPGIHFDDLHRDGVPRVREGLSVFKHQSHVAGALACRAERIAVDRRVAIADIRQRRFADYAVILGRVDHILARSCDSIIDVVDRNGATLAEGFQLGRQRVDGGVPLALVGIVAIRAEAFQFRQITRAKHIQVEVILAGGFVDELALEDQPSEGASVGVVIETLLQARG